MKEKTNKFYLQVNISQRNVILKLGYTLKY